MKRKKKERQKSLTFTYFCYVAEHTAHRRPWVRKGYILQSFLFSAFVFLFWDEILHRHI